MELQPLLKGLPVSKSSYFPLPKVEDSYISRLLFIWVFRLLKLGKNTKLEPEHTAELPESERAENEKLSGHLKRHKL